MVNVHVSLIILMTFFFKFFVLCSLILRLINQMKNRLSRNWTYLDFECHPQTGFQ